MSAQTTVLLYSAAIVAGAVAGAAIPLLGPKKQQLTLLLSFAAGVMFGAAFFHMLPEAFRGGGFIAFSLVPAGFLTLFVLERYVFVHICEEHPDHAEEHGHATPMGLTAFLGLSVHTLFDGVGLASATLEGVGLTAFIAVIAHKIPSSLSLASILKGEGRGAKQLLGYGFAFGCMVPLGALLFFALEHHFSLTSFAPKALAFSSGTFLYIAVSDLLPHVSGPTEKGRLTRVAALVAGLGAMFLLSRLHD